MKRFILKIICFLIDRYDFSIIANCNITGEIYEYLDKDLEFKTEITGEITGKHIINIYNSTYKHITREPLKSSYQRFLNKHEDKREK